MSPSDLGDLTRGEPIRVGGRIVVSADGCLRIADAFAMVEVVGLPDPPMNGELAVIEAIFDAGCLRGSTVLERSRPRDPERVAETTRFRDAGIGLCLRERARVLEAVRTWFASEKFLEVETPLSVPSPGLDLHLDAFALADTTPQRFLITSPEYQMKRLLSGGVPRCFQIARCFRRGEVGSRHNPEFTMLEWYRAFADQDAVLDDTEALVCRAAASVGRGDVIEHDGRRIDLSRPFRRITIAEAFRDLADVAEATMLAWAERDEETFFRVLVDRIEPALAREPRPVVLHRYPAQMASLARLAPDDARYAERFEVYVGGVELSNGFAELTDPVEQRARLERDREARRARRASGLPDRRALRRCARRRHAQSGGKRARPRSARRAGDRAKNDRRGARVSRGPSVSAGDAATRAPSREEIERLARKYETLADWRRKQAAGQPPPEPSALRDLAADFPGCLRELDRLPLEEIDLRRAALFLAASSGVIEPWMRWSLAYHGMLRGALWLKARRHVARGLLDVTDPLAAEASEHARYPIDTDLARTLMAKDARPLVVIALDEIARRHGVSAFEIRARLLPAAPVARAR